MGAALLPGCGGEANDSSNQYVPVSAFKNSSVGFRILGSPIVSIISRGQPGDVNPGYNPFPSIGRLDDYLDSATSNALEDWQNFAGDQEDVREADQSCWVRVSIYNSSNNEFSLDGVATYAVSGDMGYMKLSFDEVSGSSNNLEYSALIHFMGAVTRSDLTYSTDGDATDNSAATDSTVKRVIITSLTGSIMEFWFNFRTNECMTQFSYVAQVEGYDSEGRKGWTLPRMTGVWRITHPFLRVAQ